MDGANMTGQSALGPYNPIPPSWNVAATGDFNGDGQADIVWRESASGALVLWVMNGVTLSSQMSLSPFPVVSDTDWQISGATDLNGDGKSDLLWQHTLGHIGIWFMDGERVTGQAAPTPSAADPAWRIRNR
jgi:hypothetical protein